MAVVGGSRPGLAYWLGKQLYVSVTNRSNAMSLLAQRGPSFVMPPESGFCPLEEGYEPTALEVFQVVDAAYGSDPRKKVVGMGEDDEGVTFAGLGEPLLRLDVLVDSAKLIRESRHGVPFRIKTNGLVPGGDNAAAVAALRGAGIKRASVFLPGADPPAFAKFAQAEAGYHFGNVCDFVSQAAEAGIEVECTTVQRPGLDVSAVRQLAEALGAVSTRAVSFHP